MNHQKSRPRVRTAVVPAAGLGTRLRPLSLAVPKEMFPFGTRPVLDYTLQELRASGITRIAIVMRPEKEAIRDYVMACRADYSGVEFLFPLQARPLGLGDSLAAAREAIGAEPFVMAIPDQVLFGPQAATAQLIAASGNAEGIWHSQVHLSAHELAYFPGARAYRLQADSTRMLDLEGDPESPLRGFGRTLFCAEALDYMTPDYLNPVTGEVDFVRTYQALFRQFELHATTLSGQACDLGTWGGYYYYLQKQLRAGALL